MSEFNVLAQQCAPAVHPVTMAAVIRVESTFNPFAIGVVGRRLERQPVSEAEAVATAKALEAAGYNFSLGLGQVNRYNLARYGLDYRRAFEPCANLNAASRILKECFGRARTAGLREQPALLAALSCYYSGNFSTGFRAGAGGQPGYVQKVLSSAPAPARTTRIPPGDLTPDSAGSARTGPHAAGVRLTAAAPRAGPPAASTSGSAGDAVIVYR